MNCARVFTGGILALLAGNALAGFGLSEPLPLPLVGSNWEKVAIGDVTGDGRDDLVIATPTGVDPEYHGTVLIYVQQSDGTLQSPLKYQYAEYPANNWMTLADFDGDGLNDIIVGYTGSGSGGGLALLRGSINGQFLVETLLDDDIGYNSVQTADFDRDGNIDIAASKWQYGSYIFYGDGNGNIARQDHFSWSLGSLVDINSDGFDDLITNSPDSACYDVYIYLHDGSTGLESQPRVIRAGSMNHCVRRFAVGDFNDDGKGDLTVGTMDYLSVYYDAIVGRLAIRKRFALDPGVLLATDIDQDGRDDLLADDDGSASVSLFLQDVNGLQDAYVFEDSKYAFSDSIAVGDLNGDGLNDVANLGYGTAFVRYGQNEPNRPDLLATIGANAGAVAVRLENEGGGPIDTPLVSVDVSVSVGTLQSGVLPEGCVLQTELPDAIKVECLVDTMQPDAVVLLQLPISVSQTTFNVLNAAANAVTDTSESRLQNNQARKTVWLGPPNRSHPMGSAVFGVSPFTNDP